MIEGKVVGGHFGGDCHPLAPGTADEWQRPARRDVLDVVPNPGQTCQGEVTSHDHFFGDGW